MIQKVVELENKKGEDKKGMLLLCSIEIVCGVLDYVVYELVWFERGVIQF